MLVKASVFNEVRHLVAKAYHAGIDMMMLPLNHIISSGNQLAFYHAGGPEPLGFLEDQAKKGKDYDYTHLGKVHEAIQDVVKGKLELSNFMFIEKNAVFVDLQAIIAHKRVMAELHTDMAIFPKLSHKAKQPGLLSQKKLLPRIERNLIILCSTKEGIRQAQKLWDTYLPQMPSPYFIGHPQNRSLPVGSRQADPPRNYRTHNRQVLQTGIAACSKKQ